MEGIDTKELIDYYKKLMEYLKKLDNRKTEILNNLDVDESALNGESETDSNDEEKKESENKESEDVIDLDSEEKSGENA